ncbi:MAG: hypothetical protein D6698_13525 [Gammaproteobacteria bacterium]|nr:MAG: hypothetical protein D6698_13525 [Gammaproteobacteria bacterium]
MNQLRRIFLLVGECLELGADPLLWRQHLAFSIQKLVGDGVVLLAELSPNRLGNGQLAQHTVAVGWRDEKAKSSFEAYSRDDDPEENPLLTQALTSPCQLITISAHQAADEADWQQMTVYDYIHQAHLHYDCIASISRHMGGVTNLFVVHPRRESNPYPVRSKRLLWILHRELYHHLNTRLAMIGKPSVLDLPVRVRDVLICLLQGDSIKQAALRCHLSTHTAADYSKRIYQQLAVNSRGELVFRYGGLVRKLVACAPGDDCVFHNRPQDPPPS